MNCPTVCISDRPAVQTLKPIALRPEAFSRPVHNSQTELLKIARHLAQTTQPGEWERLGLEQYFGAETRSLPFRESLLPLVWAARQQLISRAGGRYRRWTLQERAQREGALLVQLHRVLAVVCQAVDTTTILDTPVATAAVCQMTLSGSWGAQSPVCSELVAIAAHWVDVTIDSLDSL
ncbi:MAG: hypothetical protein AAF722_07890 [Cyanobacteria bacterium P01_C01_bin.70]